LAFERRVAAERAEAKVRAKARGDDFTPAFDPYGYPCKADTPYDCYMDPPGAHSRLEIGWYWLYCICRAPAVLRHPAHAGVDSARLREAGMKPDINDFKTLADIRAEVGASIQSDGSRRRNAL